MDDNDDADDMLGGDTGAGDRESRLTGLGKDNFLLRLSREVLRGEGDLELLPNDESLASLDKSSFLADEAHADMEE